MKLVLPTEEYESQVMTYRAEMLGLILEQCRKSGEEKVLVCCDKYNEASAKTIIRNGGVLENEVVDTVGLTENGIIQRYWINLFKKT